VAISGTATANSKPSVAPLDNKALPKTHNFVPSMQPSSATNFGSTPNGFQNVQKKPIQNVLNIFQKKPDTTPSTTPVQSPAVVSPTPISEIGSKMNSASQSAPTETFLNQPETTISPSQGNSDTATRGSENEPVANIKPVQIDAAVPSKVPLTSSETSVNENPVIVNELPAILPSNVVVASLLPPVELLPKQETSTSHAPSVPSDSMTTIPAEVKPVMPPPTNVVPIVEEDPEEEYEIASRLVLILIVVGFKS